MASPAAALRAGLSCLQHRAPSRASFRARKQIIRSALKGRRAGGLLALTRWNSPHTALRCVPVAIPARCCLAAWPPRSRAAALTSLPVRCAPGGLCAAAACGVSLERAGPPAPSPPGAGHTSNTGSAAAALAMVACHSCCSQNDEGLAGWADEDSDALERPIAGQYHIRSFNRVGGG